MAHTDEKKDLEAGHRLPGIESQYINEKAGLRNSRVESQGSAARLKVPAFITSTRMPSFRHFLIFFTIFTVFAVTYASAAVVQVRKHHAPTEDEIQFTKLLATISDDPELHDALEQYISSKYHPGTNGGDNTAFQFLNSDNAAAATRLVELVKRQNSNGTTTTTTTSITDPPETTTSIVVPPTTSDLPPVSNPPWFICLTLLSANLCFSIPSSILSNHTAIDNYIGHSSNHTRDNRNHRTNRHLN